MKKYFSNIFVKMGVIFILTVLLLVPTNMVQNIIGERMNRHLEAVQEVNDKHADPQLISGPVITIPYKDVPIDTSLVSKNAPTKYFHVLPETLNIKGNVTPEKRKRGLFDVVVYSTDLDVKGIFSFDMLHREGISPDQLMLNRAFVTLGITDLQGVRDQIDFKLSNTAYNCDPGLISTDVVQSGLNSRITLSSIEESIPFEFDLSLNGSEELNFIPLGKETRVHLESRWQDPSFGGAFLPVSRKVHKNGFIADWKVLNINRNFPQGWKSKRHSIENAAFGVQLQLPVDIYQKSMRVAKYAILFIVLTFMVFFLVEVMQRILIHPIQYSLVGLALVLFYAMLLSLSEHIAFDSAYLTAAGLTIALILMYCRSVLKSWKVALMMASILSVTYGFIFIIIQVQDYALLMGSFGVFLILGITMFFSRKIDWFAVGSGDSSVSKKESVVEDEKNE